MNHRKKGFLCHSERDSYVKEAVGWQKKYIKEGESKCHREQENQHIQITLQQQIEWLSVLTMCWKIKALKADGKLSGSTGTSLYDFCPQVSIAICR